MEDKGRIGKDQDMPRGIKGSGEPKPCKATMEVPSGAVTTIHRCGVDLKIGHKKGLHVCRREYCTFTWPLKEKINA